MKGIILAHEEAKANINLDTLDLEEVFHAVQEDMSIQFQIEDFVNQNYGQLEFDAWKPKEIFQYILMLSLIHISEPTRPY